MTDPDYIVQVTVLSGDGSKKLLEWETGANSDDPYVIERVQGTYREPVSEPMAVALVQIHTYDLMANKPTVEWKFPHPADPLEAA